jgi:hypothetical protein
MFLCVVLLVFIKDERPVQVGQPLYVIKDKCCLFDLLPGWRENSQTATDITLRIETNLQSISETIFYQHFHIFACLYVSKTMQKYELMLQFGNYFSYFLFKMTLKKCYQQQTDI